MAKISICLPINKEISTSAGSDITAGKLSSFEAVKTTLKGDYTHTNEAIAKTTAFINNEKITPDLSWSHLEILTISKLDTKSPSKLMTEIYFPTKPKVIPVVKVPVYQPQTETQTPKPAAPAPATPKTTEEEDSEF